MNLLSMPLLGTVAVMLTSSLLALAGDATPSNVQNNCGAVALHQFAVAVNGSNAATTAIDTAPVPTNGFSLSELLELSRNAGLDLTYSIGRTIHWSKISWSIV